MSLRSTISRKLPALTLAAILSLPASRLLAADPPAPLSPAIQQAIKDFSSDDFKTRQAASVKLQLALAEQLHALLISDDPEVLARIDTLLQSNDGLTRWIIDTLKLPPDQRKAQVDFGLQPDILPSLALTFSAEPAKRVEGVRALAKIDKPEVNAILANALNDPDRAVYIAAMEAVWNKKPTDAVVEALWDRAVGDSPDVDKITGGASELTFRGQPIPGANRLLSGFLARRRPDNAVATDVLINLNPPQLPAKIINFLDNFEKATDPEAAPPEHNKLAGAMGADGNMIIRGSKGIISVPILYNPLGEPVRNVFKLAAASKDKSILPVLYKLATGEITRQTSGPGNEKYFYSNRTDPLAALVIATGQRTEDFGLKQLPGSAKSWAFTSLTDENLARKKLRDWYAANVDKNVPDIATDALAPDAPEK